MKRHCKDIKKIMQIKWRSLNFPKSPTRSIESFYSLKHYLNQMNLKNPSMIQARKNRRLKKASSDVKRTTAKVEKRLQRPHSLRKKQSPQSFLIQTQMKYNKNLTINKKVEKTVFMAEPYEGYDLSSVALYNTKYLKRMFKISAT